VGGAVRSFSGSVPSGAEKLEFQPSFVFSTIHSELYEKGRMRKNEKNGVNESLVELISE
jgi:hypothetical protein